ncbi:MAG: restriction endonuclease [Thaumarchaeota archaeon]|nr:restriction endonuclease [Nitrososphaerota archaeon]
MNNRKTVFIIKANGQKVPFNPHKVVVTCKRAGADRKLARRVSEAVGSKIRDGMSTREVYRLVLSLLSQFETGGATSHRYRLKEAIMKLGPSGFIFENYVSRILEEYGYQIKNLRKTIQGRCVIHELDIIVYHVNTKKKSFVECKYHNYPGVFTGLKESLYTHARFLDLNDLFDGEILVCNTRVSKEVIIYASCIGQQVVSWRYPPNKSLETMIQDKGLYPITILPLTRNELNSISENNIMIAKDLLEIDKNQLSAKTRISVERINKIQEITAQIITKFYSDKT